MPRWTSRVRASSPAPAFAVYLWRSTSEMPWVKAHEDLLQAHAHGQLVSARRPGRKRLQLEIACSSRSPSRALLKKFGGRIEELPRNWIERFARPRKSKPIKIGKRLVILRSGTFQPEKVSGLGKRLPDATSYGIWNRRVRDDCNAASYFGTANPPVEARLVSHGSWDRQRNSCSGGKTFWSRTTLWALITNPQQFRQQNRHKN